MVGAAFSGLASVLVMKFCLHALAIRGFQEVVGTFIS